MGFPNIGAAKMLQKCVVLAEGALTLLHFCSREEGACSRSAPVLQPSRVGQRGLASDHGRTKVHQAAKHR